MTKQEILEEAEKAYPNPLQVGPYREGFLLTVQPIYVWAPTLEGLLEKLKKEGN